MTSNGPKNFKSMQFPVSRNGTNAVYAPLPPVPVSNVITVSESERRALQLKEMKMFCNNQRCPACGSQLEGQIGFDKATLYCCASEKEYKAVFKYGTVYPVWCCTTMYTTHFAFEVINRHITDELYLNLVYKLDLAYNERFQQVEKKELLSYEGEPLVFKGKLTEDQLMDKIKLYNLFS